MVRFSSLLLFAQQLSLSPCARSDSASSLGYIRTKPAFLAPVGNQWPMIEQNDLPPQIDAERLCPGQSFQSSTGVQTLGRMDMITSIKNTQASIDGMEKEIALIREWAQGIPKTAETARQMIDGEMKRLERGVKDNQDMKQRYQNWLAEHGNTE
ncbi:hypothetical protein GQ53DRAFT_740218 [Thozetella sp. PMI_491]|nr:hypothetical protein GQ53DRAFT_740218 [Thozetella sp. PMI_491]